MNKKYELTKTEATYVNGELVELELTYERKKKQLRRRNRKVQLRNKTAREALIESLTW